MEEKIVLAVKDDLFDEYKTCLFLFRTKNRSEFVVASLESSKAKIGASVDSWSCGHYFNNIIDAVEYFKNGR